MSANESQLPNHGALPGEAAPPTLLPAFRSPGCAPHFALRTQSLPRLGLLAAWGRYPIVIAEALAEQGYATYCLGLKGHADPAIARLCADFDWLGLGKVGRACRYFRRNGIHHAMVAGKVHKHILFQPGVCYKHLPDWRTIRAFYKHFLLNRRDRRDDTLMNTLLGEFAVDGITFFPPTDFAPELLVNEGQLTRRGPSESQRLDIEFGWQLAKELGRLDVGQSVAVKGRTALAVEAVEGTDQCIRRAGELCKQGGFTVVKVSKPQQDMRFDVPTIGLGTLHTMIEAGAACLAIEAGKTIIVDQPEVVRFADEHRLAIVALTS
ncbi:MAG TPA: UDP-2,3-diacylglucosamine diphosphatase LpxI [Pirellulales bacterium]|nr:UDP-2,3-diacylglucosamine diphosphatase LpxI [Pirellulales bacterium]